MRDGGGAQQKKSGVRGAVTQSELLSEGMLIQV